MTPVMYILKKHFHDLYWLNGTGTEEEGINENKSFRTYKTFTFPK